VAWSNSPCSFLGGGVFDSGHLTPTPSFFLKKGSIRSTKFQRKTGRSYSRQGILFLSANSFPTVSKTLLIQYHSDLISGPAYRRANLWADRRVSAAAVSTASFLFGAQGEASITRKPHPLLLPHFANDGTTSLTSVLARAPSAATASGRFSDSCSGGCLDRQGKRVVSCGKKQAVLDGQQIAFPVTFYPVTAAISFTGSNRSACACRLRKISSGSTTHFFSAIPPRIQNLFAPP
jgi:hypothetical protein